MSASVREIKATILTKYQGNESFFGGDSALDQWVGYVVVLGFGAAFSVFTTNFRQIVVCPQLPSSKNSFGFIFCEFRKIIDYHWK